MCSQSLHGIRNQDKATPHFVVGNEQRFPFLLETGDLTFFSGDVTKISGNMTQVSGDMTMAEMTLGWLDCKPFNYTLNLSQFENETGHCLISLLTCARCFKQDRTLLYGPEFLRLIQKLQRQAKSIDNGNRTEWSPIRTNHLYDYRRNWTTWSLITNETLTKFEKESRHRFYVHKENIS